MSNFRRNLFKLVDQALDGDLVEVVHRGRTIRLVPEAQGSKLDRLTPATIFNPKFSEEEHARASREIFTEMEREWEKDWSDL